MNPKFKPQPWQLRQVFNGIVSRSQYVLKLRCRMLEVGFAENDPRRAAVERAYQALQELKRLLSYDAAAVEFLPAPKAVGGESIDLTKEQCRQIVDGLYPVANYVARLQTRFTRRRLHHDDPLSKATAALQAALQDLSMEFTYRSCKKEDGPIVPHDDPRLKR